MYRPLAAVVCLALALPACRIQPTPREYIDRQIPVTDVRQQAEDALRDRIAALVQALRTGDDEAALAALAPAAGTFIIGPGEADRFTGDQQIQALLNLISASGTADIELSDLEVGVSARATSGWFAAWLEVRPSEGEPIALRFTGVYLNREGTWELAQAHLSTPSPVLLTAPVPYPPRDSPATGRGSLPPPVAPGR
ncbi:hypothetical protein BH23GEM3_BH23GEM3_19860 [soil metagenome]